VLELDELELNVVNGDEIMEGRLVEVESVL